MLARVALMFVTVTHVSTPPYDFEFGVDVFVSVTFVELPGIRIADVAAVRPVVQVRFARRPPAA